MKETKDPIYRSSKFDRPGQDDCDKGATFGQGHGDAASLAELRQANVTLSFIRLALEKPAGQTGGMTQAEWTAFKNQFRRRVERLEALGDEPAP